MYLTPNKLSLKTCYQNLLFINKNENKDWQVPALRTVHKWVEDNVPEPVIILHREGKKAYEAKCAPYIQSDLNDVAAGQIWVGDHHQFDFWIRHKNSWLRPWITAWMDMKSRCIVGWHLSTGPNQTTVLISMRAGIEKYGPPDGVKIDNGKDYDSQMFTGITKRERKRGCLDEFLVSGIYGMMNISASFATPFNAKAKPIERLFATVAGQFSKTIPTYCGKSTQTRPEDLQARLGQQSVIDSALTFDSLTELFGRWVEAYNNTAHSGAGMDGRSPAQAMNMRVSKRVISSEVLDMLMCVWSGKLKVGKNGIRFHGLLYGQYEPRLLQQFGKIVRVAYNPNDLRTLTVYDAESLQRLCIAEQNQLVRYNQAVGEETLREAMQQKAGIIRAHRNWIDKQGQQHLDLTDLTIKAMNDSAVKEIEQPASPMLRPVKTPLDLHLAEHLQEVKQRILRKAAGAENTRVIDIDLSSLTQPKNKPREKLKLFEK
jgi:transposase InsO family protein